MTERVIICFDDGHDMATALEIIQGKGCYNVLCSGCDTITLLVPDSRDAEEEITELMNESGIPCFVYKDAS